MMRSLTLLFLLGALSGSAHAQPSSPAPYPVKIFSSSGPLTAAASTGEQNLATVAIPANLLGAGGQIRIHVTYLNNNNGNNKTFTIRFASTSAAVSGGFTVFNVVNTTNTGFSGIAMIRNQSTTTQQVTSANGAIGLGNNFTGAIDTTAATFICFNANLAVNTDTAQLAGYTVEVFPSGVTW